MGWGTKWGLVLGVNRAMGVRFRARLRGQGSDPSSGCRRLVGGEERVRGLEPQTSALLHPAALGTPQGAGGVLGCHAKGSPPGGSWGVPGPQHLRRPRPLPWLLSLSSDFVGPEGGGSEKGRVSAPAPPSSPAPTFLSRPHLPLPPPPVLPDSFLPLFSPKHNGTGTGTVCCSHLPGAECSLVFSHFIPFALPWVGPAAPCYRRVNRGRGGKAMRGEDQGLHPGHTPPPPPPQSLGCSAPAPSLLLSCISVSCH